MYKKELILETESYELGKIVDNVKKIQEEFNELYNKMESMKVDNNLKILPVSRGTWYQRINVKCHKNPEIAETYITNLYNENLKIYESNEINIRNNDKVYNKVITLLTELGLSKTKFDKKFKSRTCDWVLELGTLIPTINPLRDLENDYISYKRVIEDWKKEIQKTKDDYNKLLEKDKKNKELILLLAKISLEYEFELNNLNAEDIVDLLIDKNKYLKLAHYLCLNRGDWNEGCNYAECGLDGFSIDNLQDKAIYNEIKEMIDNWENYMDGRCFRDCQYNYDYLFDKVKELDLKLYNYYIKLQEYL